MNKIPLKVVYEFYNGYWQAHIVDSEHIRVLKADSVEEARAILKIIIREELAQLTHIHTKEFEFVEEHIFHTVIDKTDFKETIGFRNGKPLC